MEAAYFRVSGIALLAVVAITLYKYVIYPSVISPLARLPTAHPLCNFTSQWFEHQVSNQRELKTLYAAHQRCGPIVRLGPSEVSVVSEEGLRKIYTAGLDKDKWYKKHFYNYGRQNLVCTLDHRMHSIHKRMISSVYQKSYVQRSQNMEMLSRRIILDRFMPLLEDWSIEGENVDVVQLFEWTGVDMMTAYLFGTGNRTNFLQDTEMRHHYFDEWAMMRERSDYSQKPITEDLCMRMCKAATFSDATSNIDRTASEPTVMSKMYNQMLALNKMTDSSKSNEDILIDCASEMLDHIIATQETMTITWTYVLYQLSLRPSLQQKLRLELSSLKPPVSLSNKDEGLPNPADIYRLPFLNAVIYETLRLHAANPARLPRVVPRGGLSLHGYHVPAGTKISSNAYCLHRNEEAFPSPQSWEPERWLSTVDGDESAPSLNVLRKYFFAFGGGSRMCVGQHFAIQGL